MKYLNAKTIFLFTVLVFIAFAVGIFIFITQVHYETLISSLTAIINKPGVENILRNKVLPLDKFNFIKQLCYAGLLLLPILAFFLIKLRYKIIEFLRLIWRSIYDSCKGVLKTCWGDSKKENIILLLVLLVIIIKSLYYIIAWDLQYDEMWCYNYYTAQPFYFSFFMYSNYPLYELSTNLFEWLPFSMKINLRLPVLIMGVAACILLYACLKKYFNNQTAALAGTVLFACMPVTTFYMLYARGVIFEIFFAVAALFSLLFWLRDAGKQKKYFIIYVLANVLGIYAMPTHIYFWLILCFIGICACVFRNKPLIKKIIIANLLVVLCAAILYLPIFSVSGFSFVETAMADKTSMETTFKNCLNIATDISTFLTGFAYSLVAVFIIYGLLLVIKQYKAYRLLITLCISLCLLPVATYIVQGFYIPERAWAFVGLVIPLTTSLLFVIIEKCLQLFTVDISIFILGTGAAIVSNQHTFLNWSKGQDEQAIVIANLFMQNNIHTCYDKSIGSKFFYYYPGIEFYYKLKKEHIGFNMFAQNSMRYKPFEASDNYDCIVYKLNDTDTTNANSYKEIYRNTDEGFKIMLRNK